jgi:hypothetical protein
MSYYLVLILPQYSKDTRMTLKSIKLDSNRDKQYERLYMYFIDCEERKKSPKVRVIMDILKKTDATVYGRIRRHWNEFIFEHPSRPEYVVDGLKDKCPKKYFVLYASKLIMRYG